ncbi:MAG: nicotinamide N-methylase [Frankiales bacterium]|nr:nicotinamide N-methylase [Frankiales bacterium]
MQHASWLALEPVPFVPEVTLHQADDLQGLWETVGTPAPPYWAFAWLGGQALARYLLDGEAVRGKRVLDLATGSGLVAVAAMKAGARSVLAADVDPLSQEAVAANAAANGVDVMWTGLDLLDGPVPHVEVVLAGDVLYEQQMAARVLTWLGGFAGTVLLGDPGRDYLPQQGLVELAAYDIATTRELEGVPVKRVRVFTLPQGAPPPGAP